MKFIHHVLIKLIFVVWCFLCVALMVWPGLLAEPFQIEPVYIGLIKLGLMAWLFGSLLLLPASTSKKLGPLSFRVIQILGSFALFFDVCLIVLSQVISPSWLLIPCLHFAIQIRALIKSSAHA